MAWVRGFVAFLGLLQAGYMTVDGVHAIVRGNYVTVLPRVARFERARLRDPSAPFLWEGVVKSAGIDPRSVWMKLFFVAYGLAWLAVIYRFVAGRAWGRAGMILMVIGSLWWIGPATFLAISQLLLLILLPSNRPPPAPIAVVESVLVESVPIESAAIESAPSAPLATEPPAVVEDLLATEPPPDLPTTT